MTWSYNQNVDILTVTLTIASVSGTLPETQSCTELPRLPLTRCCNASRLMPLPGLSFPGESQSYYNYSCEIQWIDALTETSHRVRTKPLVRILDPSGLVYLSQWEQADQRQGLV